MAADNRNEVDFLVCYFKVKGLNPHAYARRKKMAEKQDVSWPGEVALCRILSLLFSS
jgi:hypothetical protein